MNNQLTSTTTELISNANQKMSTVDTQRIAGRKS